MSPIVHHNGKVMTYMDEGTDLLRDETLEDYARRRPESNRCDSLCRRVRSHSATAPWPRRLYAIAALLMLLAILVPGEADASSVSRHCATLPGQH